VRYNLWVTARQTLRELVSELPEAEAERVLKLVTDDDDAPDYAGPSNAHHLAELVRQWDAEDAELDPKRLAEIQQALANLERVRFREPSDWHE